MQAYEEPEIYETPDEPSDNRSPEQRYPVPSSARNGGTATVDIADVVEHTLNARESFEVFMGRRYDPAERSFGEDAVITQAVMTPSHERFDDLAKVLTKSLEKGIAGGRTGLSAPRKLETPLERYSRLVQEVSSLQSELRAIEAGDARRAPGSTVVDHASGVFPVLSKGAASVQQQLDSLQERVGTLSAHIPLSMDAISPAHPPTTVDTLQALRQQVEGMRQAQADMVRAGQAMESTLAALQHRLDMLLSSSGALH